MRPPLQTAEARLLALGLAMGKKSRAVPGRRPILQLSPPGPRSSTPGRDPDPDPDPEADSTAAATIQSAPAAAATSPAVPATAAPEDSPSEGKCARGAPAFIWDVRNSSPGLEA